MKAFLCGMVLFIVTMFFIASYTNIGWERGEVTAVDYHQMTVRVWLEESQQYGYAPALTKHVFYWVKPGRQVWIKRQYFLSPHPNILDLAPVDW